MTAYEGSRPSVVLVCHDGDRIDHQALAAWLATTMRLVGVLAIREPFRRRLRVARREWRRSGLTGVVDAAACRLYCALVHGRRDAEWIAGEVERLRRRYPSPVDGVPQLTVSTPNCDEARQFLARCQPDLMVVRSKFILRPEIYSIARAGSYVLHPGICPEYRNAHGCFWALVRRDLGRVGITMLRIDPGVDTGPVYFQAGCRFDERRESHVVIQYRVLTENLDAIARTLTALAAGRAAPISTQGRPSAVWGQPRLSAYWRWKWAARRNEADAHRVAPVS